MESILFLFLLLICLSPAVGQRQSKASVPPQEDSRTGLDSIRMSLEDIRTGSDIPPELPVLWDELLGLKELVLSLKTEEVEQRQVLRTMESRLRDGEVEAETQRRSLDRLEDLRDTVVRTEADRRLLMELNSDLRRRVEELEEQSRARSSEVLKLQSHLNSSESSLDDLKKKNSALAAELPFLQTRLRASESTVEQLRRKNAVLSVRLCHTESLMEELMKQTSAFPGSNSSSPSEASELNVRLEELNTNTQVLQSRLNSLQEKLNSSAERETLRLIRDQVSEISSRLNSSQHHLDELKRHAADQTGRLESVERQVDELKTEDTVLMDRLSVGERRLDELQTRTAVQADTVTQLLTDGTDQTSKLMKLQRKLNLTESVLETVNTALEVRLRSTETQLEHLKTQNTDRLSAVQRETEVLQVQLRVSEDKVNQLKMKTDVQTDRLSLMESRLMDRINNTTALEVRLRVSEKQLEDLKTQNTALEVKLRVSEKQLEDLKTQNTVQSDQLSLMESRLMDRNSNTTALEVKLRVSEKQLEDLKTQNTVQSDQLSSMESRLTERHNNMTAALEVRLRSTETQLENHTAALEVKLRVSEKQLEDLKTQNTVQSDQLSSMESRLMDRINTKGNLKVAFSAGLTDSGAVGPFNEEMTLLFSKTITNIGQAYNQTAGVFTAPVRGLYFFSFTAADYLKGYMGLYLYRNNQPILFNLELNDHGGYASTSNSVALQLEQGDGVRLSLPASYRLYDDLRNFSLFSGFLLFPL